MDKKEDSEKFIKSEISSSTPIQPLTSTNSTNLSKTNDIDATADSCDILASWTLVNDKKNNKGENDEHVETLKNSDDEEQDEHDDEEDADACFDKEADSSNKYSYDDVSDGVSVVSDTESLDDGASYEKTQLHVRESCPDCGPLPPEDPFNRNLKEATTCVLKMTYSLTKRGLSCALYVFIGVALLGFLGNICNTNWRPFPAIVNNFPSTDQLQQKVNEMELQNNLMRAEIDLLNKQVKYLSTLNDPQQQKSVKYKDHKDGKVFKVWPGNGDSLKPVDVTKQDLKKPYKCPDGSFVEIANMCLEQQSTADPSIVDQFGQVMENLKQQFEDSVAFEEVTEAAQGLPDKPPAESNLYASHKHNKNEDKSNNEYKKPNCHEWKKSRGGCRRSAEMHHDDDGSEWVRNSYKSDEDDDDDDDDSGEWHEKYMKHRAQERSKNEYKSGSHERHDKYKKHGEQQQKNQYKKYGQSRENKRSGEKQYR